jgi:hypothetical protein
MAITPGSQFITLYRGFNNKARTEIDNDNLGMHWTPNKEAARGFSLGIDPHETDPNNWEPESSKGTVLEARVHSRHVLQHGSKEHNNLLKERAEKELPAIYTPHNAPDEHAVEQEHTIRKGAPVHIVAAHTVLGADKGTPKMHTRTYRGTKRGKA